MKNYLTVEGKHHNISSRKYCLTCSPFKKGNTKKIHLPHSNSPSKKYKNLSDSEKRELNQSSYLKQKQTRLKKKRKLVEMKGGGCEICGYCKCMYALQFHHTDPSKKLFNLTYRDISSIKWSEVLKELDKCQLLCANCHAESHYDINSKKK